MDPLSDVLSLLKPRSYKCGGFQAGGDWAVRFDRHDGIKCYAIVSGQCWLVVEGAPAPAHLNAGDCFLLPRGWSFRLASGLDVPPVDGMTVFPTLPRHDGIARFKGGGSGNGGGSDDGDFSLLGGHFILDGSPAGLLLGELPPIVHIRSDVGRAALRGSIDQMRRELRDPQPGSFLVAQHLAYTMLIQALRLHLTDGGRDSVGWLSALADKQMSAAIAALHNDPARRWTLRQLADHTGMSRSTFALKFKATVGQAPMEYLTRWRMLLAGDRLEHTGDSVAVIALSLGYESESAFSTAFKRVMGRSPRHYGRDRSAPAEQHARTGE